MRRIAASFRDPVRRPRAIAWSVVVVLLAAGGYIGMNAVTSTRWFCNQVCHNVHLDNAAAYYNASHSEISCIACHYPPNMDPLSLAVDRADKMADVPPAITGDFEMPLNPNSRLALSIPEEQCLQCHNTDRNTPVSPGIVIDHAAHREKGITCGACHNRVAHKEGDLKLPGNKPHEDFMQMTACFRCHSLTGKSVSEYEAPGACKTCHPKDFDLVPPTHDVKNWYDAKGDSSGHAKAAKAGIEHAAELGAEWAKEKSGFEDHEPRPLAAIALKMVNYDESLKVMVPPVGTVDECKTCHKPDFCSSCHGTDIPHKPDFREAHNKLNKPADAAKCASCHNETHDAKYASMACSQCHHKTWDPRKGTWGSQHMASIRAKGSAAVDECRSCHEDESFCSDCHVAGRQPGY